MGRDFVFTNSSTNQIGNKKRTVARKFLIGPKASRFIAVVVFTTLGIIYLTQSTQGADRSYKVRDLSSEKTQLLEQRDRLKIEESRLESLNEIDKSINPESIPEEENKLTPVSQVNYLSNDRIASSQ
jgi:hypothetical protein